MNSAFKIKMRITVTVKAVMRTRKARGAYPPKKGEKTLRRLCSCCEVKFFITLLHHNMLQSMIISNCFFKITLEVLILLILLILYHKHFHFAIFFTKKQR